MQENALAYSTPPDPLAGGEGANPTFGFSGFGPSGRACPCPLFSSPKLKFWPLFTYEDFFFQPFEIC